MAPGGFQHGFFKRMTTFVTGVETSRDHDGGAYTISAASCNDSGNGSCRCRDDDKIDRFAYLFQRSVTGLPVQFFMFRVDGINRAIEAAVAQVVIDASRYRVGALVGSENGDGLGCKKVI